MAFKVAINGLGRIGRIAFRQILERNDLEIVAINSRGSIESHRHLLKYDSIYGVLDKDIIIEDDYLLVGESRVKVFREDKPEDIEWSSEKVDIVIESTGIFTKREDASKHLGGTVKKVIISAPGNGEDATFVVGVNDQEYDPDKHDVVSNASCTTNCLAPVAMVLDKEFGIVKGQMTTIHAFTNDQNILDNSHKKDLRRARTATSSIIPTTTGAAQAVSRVLPNLEGKLTGLAVRTPSPCVSLVDLVVELKKDVSKDEVNKALEDYSNNSLKDILHVSYLPLVSIDFKGSEYSSIVDGLLTEVIGGNLVKVLAWYDNEWGYSARLVDLVSMIGNT